jgi:hypothetical protein
MNQLNKTLVIIFGIFFTLSLYSAPSGKDSIRYEILMNNQLISTLHINSNFINTLQVTSKNQILLASYSRFYLLGLGDIIAFGNAANPSVESFAFTHDSLLMVVRNNELCYMDSLGNLSQLFKLPNTGMGISAGKMMMFLYDRYSTNNVYALYILQPGGQYIKLLDMPKPIYAVTELNNSLLLSVENALLKLDLTTKALKVMATAPSGEIIKSIAVNPETGRVFFSSDNRIYVLGDTKIMAISDKFGGTLLYNKGLIIFNPAKKLIVRLAGSDAAFITEAEQKPAVPVAGAIQPQVTSTTDAAIEKPVQVLTNQNIIDLVENKLSDDLIVNIISHSKVNFNLSVDSMVELSNQQVSSKVIMAMKQAMKNQGTTTK